MPNVALKYDSTNRTIIKDMLTVNPTMTVKMFQAAWEEIYYIRKLRNGFKHMFQVPDSELEYLNKLMPPGSVTQVKN